MQMAEVLLLFIIILPNGVIFRVWKETDSNVFDIKFKFCQSNHFLDTLLRENKIHRISAPYRINDDDLFRSMFYIYLQLLSNVILKNNVYFFPLKTLIHSTKQCRSCRTVYFESYSEQRVDIQFSKQIKKTKNVPFLF